MVPISARLAFRGMMGPGKELMFPTKLQQKEGECPS